MDRLIHFMLAETKWNIYGIIGYLVVSGFLINTVAAEVHMQTYTYKQVRDLEIKANVYREDDEKIRPVVAWIHGGAFYQFCRQRGIWPREVSGWDPHKEAKKYEPYMPVNNVTSKYPPTLVLRTTTTQHYTFYSNP